MRTRGPAGPRLADRLSSGRRGATSPMPPPAERQRHLLRPHRLPSVRGNPDQSVPLSENAASGIPPRHGPAETSTADNPTPCRPFCPARRTGAVRTPAFGQSVGTAAAATRINAGTTTTVIPARNESGPSPVRPRLRSGRMAAGPTPLPRRLGLRSAWVTLPHTAGVPSLPCHLTRGGSPSQAAGRTTTTSPSEAASPSLP